MPRSDALTRTKRDRRRAGEAPRARVKRLELVRRRPDRTPSSALYFKRQRRRSRFADEGVAGALQGRGWARRKHPSANLLNYFDLLLFFGIAYTEQRPLAVATSAQPYETQEQKKLMLFKSTRRPPLRSVSCYAIPRRRARHTRWSGAHAARRAQTATWCDALMYAFVSVQLANARGAPRAFCLTCTSMRSTRRVGRVCYRSQAAVRSHAELCPPPCRGGRAPSRRGARAHAVATRAAPLISRPASRSWRASGLACERRRLRARLRRKTPRLYTLSHAH